MRKLTRSHSTCTVGGNGGRDRGGPARSEEHTSELQSRSDLVCRLLLEKKKKSHRSNHQPRQNGTPNGRNPRRGREITRPHTHPQRRNHQLSVHPTQTATATTSRQNSNL